MSSAAEKTIYRLSGICGLLLAAAFVAPRFAPGEDGFAAAAGAALLFGGILLAAAGLATYLFAKTLRASKTLSTAGRICGVAPAVIVVAGLLVLWSFLRL
jgi:hypothetical protein